MFGLGFQELLVILAIILVLFGGKKIPELTRSIGRAIKDIRHGFTDDTTSGSEKDKESKG
ncbi:MAG: twin-arginine translocase TatA/TatE family subunit [Patescibacteria group bacterium]